MRDPSGDTTCRVIIDPTTSCIRVQCFGSLSLDNYSTEFYMSLNDTPKWVQDRVNSLSVLEPNPLDEIDGVGSRTEENTYWVIK